ncbi:uncharacterized protein LOC115344868 [Aquila chrysaetos chrysaetos]|uniref:uncharacterized protein LOC115344868 n=1 Tax=Aquila chrysaetos chrysaetos TaxID=223781 RepID=UPI001177201F|nr:uncharacterized protein LOC115344868 [Aquila chrysaetos chrysaetos]
MWRRCGKPSRSMKPSGKRSRSYSGSETLRMQAPSAMWSHMQGGWRVDSFHSCEVEHMYLNRSLGGAGRSTEQTSGRGFFPAELEPPERYSGCSGCHRSAPNLWLKSMSFLLSSDRLSSPQKERFLRPGERCRDLPMIGARKRGDIVKDASGSCCVKLQSTEREQSASGRGNRETAVEELGQGHLVNEVQRQCPSAVA